MPRKSLPANELKRTALLEKEGVLFCKKSFLRNDRDKTPAPVRRSDRRWLGFRTARLPGGSLI
ncbi:hypothetical protein Pla144_26870 [Bythopirellula polymerisocia]|uniref:Uncharacterized protein n=1 Tax=Bythopirellula polymerisocia TaxID=2528003 RepID=A0A5C6CMA0_9BACT|nr:hypothetical protein Pla144_26870 [Bythopirellula polymerisocia]